MGDDNPAATRTVTLQFHYIKGASYREVICDGVIGGATPSQGSIWMGLFAERGPIPQVVEFEVPAQEGDKIVEFNESGSKPSRVEQKGGVIRHVEVTAYMSFEAAKRIHKWLGDQLAAAPVGKSGT